MAEESPQASIRRLQQYGIRPKRDLGQNFLIDSNILGVIDRAAELQPDDVVLEVGGGLGVLSEYLAAKVAHTHVVEVDGGLEDPLREALAPYSDRSTLHLVDALELDLTALNPPPTKVVANLPYNIGATVLINTITDLPTVTRWVAMVQKEVGQRFAARVGGPYEDAYGIPSVIAQLACEVSVYRNISRRVFHPVPNVDSVLVLFQRTGAAPPPELRAFVQGAFAHRRKALARSVALHTGNGDDRERIRRALAAQGHPEDVRAERLAPSEFAALWEAVRT